MKNQARIDRVVAVEVQRSQKRSIQRSGLRDLEVDLTVGRLARAVDAARRAVAVAVDQDWIIARTPRIPDR